MSNEFDVNSGFLFAVVAVIILFVVAQSIFFLIKAWRRGKEIGISKDKLRGTLFSSALFTVIPAFAILIGVLTLSKKLGLPLPWLRLSVIGALTYELTAAEAAATSVGASLSESSVALTGPQYASIAWVMTFGIVMSLILVPILCKKLLGGVSKLKTKDEKWGGIFMDALYLGMISAFLGVIFADVREGLTGWIPVFVMAASAIVMAVLGLIVKKGGVKWLADYALPLSMLSGMALAIPITNLVNMVAA